MNQRSEERKSNRLKEYDYSQYGTYFLTVCAEKRARIFGRIVGDGVLDVPKMELTFYGKIVEDTLRSIMEHYDHITIDKYVLMPNHIHMLVSIKIEGTSRTPSPTANAIIPSFISTWKRFSNKRAGRQLFQRSYYDHVIRNEADYLACWKYIDENPIKWNEDELYTKE